MIARLVDKRDDARLAVTLTALSALSLLAILADDLWTKSLFRPSTPSTYAFVAAVIALGGLGPWLAWTRRGRSVNVSCGDGVVQAGRLRIAASDVTALSVASAARGKSVAIAYGKKRLAFLEVERAEDAARIADALGVAHPPLGEVPSPPANRLLALPQALLSFVALAFAPLYYVAAVHASTFVVGIDQKAAFGLSGLVCTQLGALLLLVRALARGHSVAMGQGAWHAHVAVHRGGEGEASAKELEPVRVGSLARGDEGVAAWLARLDALPTEQHAYRGDAMKKDVLWETLGDAGAALDARMGAARVLRRRYGEEEDALVRVIDDPDVRVRVEAALEEHEDAERQLHTLGPLFRAR